MSASGTSTKKSSSRSVATKALIIQEFKRRLRDNIRSLNDNFFHIVSAAKINSDEMSHKHASDKMTEFFTAKNEMAVRAALMVRAGDELLKLTNELKEFLVLHDFNFLTHAIKAAEKECEDSLKRQSESHLAMRTDVSGLIADIDAELAENFSFYH